MAKFENTRELDNISLYMQSIEQRLAESERMLFVLAEIADSAYVSLATGDTEKCQLKLGELIQSISEHFFEEFH
jgi:hypothetical protein